MASNHHVVAIPNPGRGHVNPMMILSRQLIAHGVHVTMIVTEEWLGLLNSAHPLPPPELNIMTISNCIPSERGRAKDLMGFINAVYTKMAEPFEELLDRLEPAPQVIIADTYLPWVVEVGNRRGIPVCSLFTMSAAMFSVLLHFERIPPPENPHSPVREKDELLEKYIPSLPSIKLSDVDLLFGRPTLEHVLQAASTAKKAQCMLFTSFYELEPCTIDSIREDLNYPVYTIGPSIPHMLLPEANSSDHLTTWLDSQPKNSVLYISLLKKDELLEKYIPSLPSIKLSDVDLLLARSTLEHVLQAASTAKKAQCMLFTSFYELEPCTIDSIREDLNYPVYTIGPSIPHMLLPEANSSDHLTWLDSQPKNSVLYISLGSYLSVSLSQFEEIATGVHASKVKFVWVARENSSLVQEICGDNGLVVPWCDQLKVLTHPSVGGFLTHCGFNSTLETLFAGVPVLALPIIFDQLSDSRLLADEWNVGLNLRDKKGKKGILSRDEIKDVVEKLMDLRNTESNDMRKRASDWSRAANIAVKDGGSSFISLGNFVSDFIDRVNKMQKK